MATYYKYAERDADSYVNWAQVGKGITDMLKDEVKIREDKKQAIETAFNEDMKTLQNVEQGAWQDGNAAINNFAHDMMAQQLIDNKLLKSGQMKPRDYTLRRQNYNSQTNTLLDLSKLLQENRASAMKEYEEGKMQGLGIANMSEVEAYTNFAKSKAIINPYSAVISMGIYDTQIVNGKSVPVLKQTLSANALRNAISHRPKTFDVDKATTATANGLGEDLISVYNEATTTKAGTIIKLTGTANDELQNPEFAKQIKLFNTAINDKVESYFANPYNLTSVLTENIGYSPESYTSDKNVAAKDKSKILLKTDPLTGLRTIDETGPNYAAQKKEAVDWVRGQLLSKIDAKREITTTAYVPTPTRYEWEAMGYKDEKEALSAAGSWNQLYTGKTVAEKQAAADIILGTPIAKSEGLLGIGFNAEGGIELSYDNTKKNRTIAVIDASGNPISLDNFSAIGVEFTGEVDRKKAVKAGGGGTGYGKLTPEEFLKVRSSRQGGTTIAPVVNITADLFRIKSPKSVERLQGLLPKDFVVTDEGKGTWNNNVKVVAPNGKTHTYNANISSAAEAETEKEALLEFIKVNGAAVSSDSKGVGSKYNK